MIKIPVKKTKWLLIALIAIIVIHVSFEESKTYYIYDNQFYFHANEMEYQALLNSSAFVQVLDGVNHSEISYLSILPGWSVHMIYIAYAAVFILFILSVKIERNED